MKEEEICLNKETKVGENELTHERDALPSCIDELREEFSCAICLEICFEPSTTPCGHSFCRSCLLRVTLKCDKKCPKCRQLISIGSSRTVNVVIWNTIQLLFPKEVEARKIALKNAKIATFSIRQAAPRNVQPFAESLFGFSDKLSCFSPGDVIEMKLEVMEYNQEEMGLAIKELKLAEPTNQTPSSILFTRFWKIVKSTKIFCM